MNTVDLTIQAILNIFETSAVRGRYDQVTLIEGDTGGLTYGRSQTTINSGNLLILLDQYCGDAARPYAGELKAYRPRVVAKDVALEKDAYFKNLLRAAADYPEMRDIQDAFFDQTYYQPAMQAAAARGLKTAIGRALVYDGYVHGSFEKMAKRVKDQYGAGLAEKTWCSRYIEVRRHWLATHPRLDLRPTVYRMDAFKALVAAGEWDLELPLVVRGVTISAASLAAPPPGVFDGPKTGSRDLAVDGGVMRGRDVRAVQLALSRKPFAAPIGADGAFGKVSSQQVKRFQAANGLPATGVVAASTFKTLGLA